MTKTALISACLLGIACQYDGACSPYALDDETIHSLDLNLVPVCPEQLGGMPTPRLPAEIRGGDGSDVLAGRAKVVNREGQDVTHHFLQGARHTLHIAQLTGASMMISRPRSPSCACSRTYDGTFSGRLVDGMGVTAALLRQETEMELVASDTAAITGVTGRTDIRISWASALPPEVCEELLAAALCEGFEPIQWLCDDWQTGTNRFSKPGEALYVARFEGRLVGVCGLNRDPFVEDTATGRLRRLYVLPRFRRLGIGRAIVQRVRDDAGRHFDRIRLRTLDPQSAAFFEATGFHRVEGVSEATHEKALNPPHGRGEALPAAACD